MTPSNARGLRAPCKWRKTARPEQKTPEDDAWHIWLILAGRGWGKTRTGAEDIAAFALWNGGVRIAIVAPTFADARDVCVEGESGLLSVLPRDSVQSWRRSMGDLRLTNGSRIKLFSADRPDRLRGPQHHRAWCDELAAWPNRDAFDQLRFGMRLGKTPQIVVTTTPRNTPLIRELLKQKNNGIFVTHGKTLDNRDNLPPRVLDQLIERYGGTRIGRQELDAELLDDTEGALWTRQTIDANRVLHAPELARIVVAIDPAMSSNAGSDETGIVAVGRDKDNIIYVLADWSCRDKPDAWAKRAVTLYEERRAHVIVAEVNAGGEMVERILRQSDARVAFKAVHASRNKVERALPIAALYEQGKVKHVGSLPKLEDQMCRFTMNGFAEGSPDRVDALVWAVTELSERGRGAPKVRGV